MENKYDGFEYKAGKLELLKDWFYNILGLNKIVDLLGELVSDNNYLEDDVDTLNGKFQSLNNRVRVIEQVVCELQIKNMQEKLDSEIMKLDKENKENKKSNKPKGFKRSNSPKGKSSK